MSDEKERTIKLIDGPHKDSIHASIPYASTQSASTEAPAQSTKPKTQPTENASIPNDQAKKKEKG
jgi:hypothetical protein